MPSFPGFRGTLRLLHVKLFLLVFVATSQVFAAGEPAQDFIKQLRAAKYFDTALTYLDRISEYPGVSEDFLDAIPLEKAQTYIELAISSRNGDKRNESFRLAETEITSFLKKRRASTAVRGSFETGQIAVGSGNTVDVRRTR